MLVVDTTPVVGLPQHRGWSQVFLSANRTLLVCFAVEGEAAHNVGRDVVDLLKATADRDNGHTTQLEPKDFHQLLISLQKETQNKDCSISLSAGLFMLDKKQVVLASDQGHVWLKRDQKIGHLLTAKNELQFIQGSLQLGDILVFATQQADSVLGEVEQRFEQGYEVDSIVTSLVPGLHGLPDSSRSAIAFSTVQDRKLSHDFESDAPEDTSEVFTPNLTSPMSEIETDLTAELGQQEEERQPESITSLPVIGVSPSSYLSSSPDRQSTSIPTADPRVATADLIDRTKTVFAGLINQIKKMLPLQKDIYVQTSSKKKLMRVVFVVLLVLIPVLTAGTWWYEQVRAKNEQAQAVTQPLADRLAALRELAETDPIAARQQTEVLLNDLEETQAQLVSQKLDVKLISALLDDARSFYDSISGQEEFSELPSFFNLRNIDTEFITAAVDFDGSNAYFVDAERGRVIKLEIESKQQSLYQLSQSGVEVGTVVDIALKKPNELVLLSNQGLFLLDLDSDPAQPSVEQLRTAEAENQSAVQLDTFGDFIYVVSNDTQNIHRYVPADEGYAGPSSWVTGGVLPLSDVSSMLIDSDVWLGNQAGELVRMRSGKRETFEVSGLPENMDSKLILYTAEGSDNLYVLEPNKSRLVVLTKQGQFLREISSGTLASATGLFVNADETTAFVVSGAEIFQTELQDVVADDESDTSVEAETEPASDPEPTPEVGESEPETVTEETDGETT